MPLIGLATDQPGAQGAFVVLTVNPIIAVAVSAVLREPAPPHPAPPHPAPAIDADLQP